MPYWDEVIQTWGRCLGYLAPARNPDLQQVLLGGLRDLGYVEGQTL
jgi:hypothetical protein